MGHYREENKSYNNISDSNQPCVSLVTLDHSILYQYYFMLLLGYYYDLSY